MSQITITVSGGARAAVRAEVGTIRLRASATRDVPAAALDDTLAIQRAAEAVLAGAHRVIVEQLSSWTQHRDNGDGEALAPRYVTSVGIRAEYRDASRLGEAAARLAVIGGIDVEGITWSLTEATRLAEEARVRREAIADAQAKARDYAAALGRDVVDLVELADPGLLAGSGGSGPSPMMAMRGAMAVSAAVEFAPDDIDVTAQVEARFVASDAPA